MNETRAAAPLLICAWATNEGVVGSTQRLAIDMTPERTPVAKTRAATGRPLLSNGLLGADLLHLPAGEGFSPHTHPGDHLLFVLAGEGTITIDGTINRTTAGQAYLIEGAVPHAVGAVTDHIILAVGAPHRPLTSMERQELVASSALLDPAGIITCLICGVTARRGEDLADQGCPHCPTAPGDASAP
jgi:quercetin dioxygenase-like cupin family protein